MTRYMNTLINKLPHTLLTNIFYLWRIFGTAISFALFGVFGMAIGLVLSFLQLVGILNQKKLQHTARATISYSFQIYILFMQSIGLLKIEVIGQEQLSQPGAKLFIANHPTLLDVVFLISLIKDTNCIVKGKLFHNPFTRPPISACNFIHSDTPEMINNAVQALQSDENLIIFPEGTRSTPGTSLTFMRGAANIALSANINLTPITIKCSQPFLLKNTHWYSIPSSPPTVSIEIHKPLDISDINKLNIMPSKKARILTTKMTDFFTEKLFDQNDIN